MVRIQADRGSNEVCYFPHTHTIQESRKLRVGTALLCEVGQGSTSLYLVAPLTPGLCLFRMFTATEFPSLPEGNRKENAGDTEITFLGLDGKVAQVASFHIPLASTWSPLEVAS